VEQIIAHCMKFDLASERGNRRDDIRPGLRITGYRRRVTIAFSVTETRVEILRIFYGGVDWEPLLA
jgi:plasmid stabilization system protein ParE